MNYGSILLNIIIHYNNITIYSTIIDSIMVLLELLSKFKK